MPWRHSLPFLLLLLAGSALAHVRLTYPLARSPSLDYFSNRNSQGACGAPKPETNEGVRTYLEAGSIIDIEWFTAIPHMGGIRLEVLNALDEPIAIFTNFRDEYNVTQTSKSVELPPHFECMNCAIRLTHQATEYGDEFFFYSCADVNIVKAIPDGDSCLRRGKRVGGKCECSQGYTGSQCQHAEECTSNDDCGVQGVCKKNADDPKSQCFCPIGRHGERCEKESNVFRSLSDFDESLYNMREAKDNKIYWRILRDEIEMVLRYPGQSWAAIGVKPSDFVCESMIPQSDPKAHLRKIEIKVPEHIAASNNSVIQTAVDREATDSGEQCAPNEVWTECAETSRDCEASCDWTRFPETIPNCPRQCGTPRCVCKEGYVRMSNEEDACVPFDFCDKEQEPSCPSNSTFAKCGTACEPSCANMYDTAPCPASCEKPDCTCADNYVRHNGQCIYWGDCPDLESHFHTDEADASTEVVKSSQPVTVEVRAESSTSASVTMTTSRFKSVPIVPITCGVNETINECGNVCEADCQTIFTRDECNECGDPGCACLQGHARNAEGLCVYWGECPMETTTVTTVQPSSTTSTTRTTPRKDLKPKVDGDVCYGEFRFPPGCQLECQYKLNWNYVEDSDDIEFSLETKMATNSWTGVGFSADGTMVGADMIIVKSYNGELSVHDMTSEGYGAPKLDEQNDVTSVVGTHENGMLRAQFIRKRNTGDAADKQFTSECWKLMFPVTGGKLDESGNVTIHVDTPVVSDRQVCVRNCNEDKKPISVINQAKCDTEYRYPIDCQDADCEYIAKWIYNSANKEVQFNISSRNMGRWTGIGFSRDGQMTNSDIYTGWVYENKAFVTDRFAYGRQLPAIDPADRQDIYDISGSMIDDMQTISFKRKVITSDPLTDFPLDECYYFMYPIGGGRVIAKKSSDFSNPRTPIGYHDLYQPRVSTNKICLCDEKGVSIAVDKKPIRVRVRRQALQVSTPKRGNDMECTDMVVGAVIDGRGRVKDFYSPSKATPRPDSFFGGEDSLQSSAAFYEDGITTVVFRRKLKSEDKYDHSISPGPMTVIWAKGADVENYQHTTGGPAIHADPNFFISGLFKYHGKNQRGALTVDFFEDKKVEPTEHGIHLTQSTCTGTYSHPEKCVGDSCTYVISWMSDGTTARFTVKTSLHESEWSALGFSMDGSMAQSDVIIMGSQDGLATVTDQFMPHYGRPVVDEQQDIFDVETYYNNGVLIANFSRELFSEDKDDINLQKCVYLLYTPTAGIIEKSGELRKHAETPVVSSNKVCFGTCSVDKTITTEQAPKTSTVTTIAPTSEFTEKVTEKTPEKKRPTTTSTSTTLPTQPADTTHILKPTVQMPPLIKKPAYTVYEPTEAVKSRYRLWVRILNREYIPALADPQTEYYQSFTKQVTSAINEMLDKRWKGMQVSKIFEYSKGSVSAEFEVVSVKSVPRPIEIKSLLEENAIRGKIGDLAIEPSTVKAKEIENPIMEASMSPDLLRNIIIIGSASILLILAIACTCCLICKCRSTRRYNSYPIPHPAYPYGTMGVKKAPLGFDNAAYHPRHYSQTTTASTKPSGQPSPPGPEEGVPDGVGETTYQEWYSKVGSKSQQHEEALSAPPPPVPSGTRPPSTQPYVSYPNDPSAYYTLGGEHRTSVNREQTGQAQPKLYRY